MDRSEILDAAKKKVTEKDQQYGTPENNFDNIAWLWGVYLSAAHPECGKNVPVNGITPKDVAAMMALLKIARIANGNCTEDSFVDLAGYAACGGEIATEQGSADGFYE